MFGKERDFPRGEFKHKENMKMIKALCSVATLAIAVTMAGQARGQYQPAGDDGIAASPKLRQMLNDQRTTAPETAVWYQRSSEPQTVVVAPTTRDTVETPTSVVVSETAMEGTVSYQPTGPDGITASPKLRQQLNDYPSHFEVAPLR